METTCPVPEPDTRKPDTVPPPLACDAHCHVFGPVDRFPYAEKRGYTPPEATVEDFRRLQSMLGLERAVIVQATCHGTDNAAMLDAIATSEGRYRGVAMVDESFTEQDYQNLHYGGVRGARFSFARHLAGPPDFGPISRMAEIMAGFGWHIVLYLEAEDVVANADALRALPLPIVIDHMARVKPEEGVEQEAFQLLLGFLEDEKFWLKISGAERLSDMNPTYDDMVPFAQALIEAAPDRIIWGTDWPHPNMVKTMPNDGDLVDLLARYAGSAGMLKQILVDNPARLYGFDE
ncbi:MAG: amidohydrolase family protein [Pseudomonadota bacterium]|nr:amidohydrolase family protein [Pseudomonadota bacterium]